MIKANTAKSALRQAAADATSRKTAHLEFGFTSNKGFCDAVHPILTKVLAPAPQSVLHLACKNGALLAEVNAMRSETELIGIESDPVRFKLAQEMLPRRLTRLHYRSYADIEFLSTLPTVGAGIISVGRLLEIPCEMASQVVELMMRKCAVLYVYGFSDWAKQLDPNTLARKVCPQWLILPVGPGLLQVVAQP
jgi:hypothetical protein